MLSLEIKGTPNFTFCEWVLVSLSSEVSSVDFKNKKIGINKS